MTHPYENTSPERFQQFCQALLVPEFPGLQCFPVGQPDGGRDALHHDTKTVVQVKFKRSDEDENAEWMIEALTEELPKIQKLVKAGAEQYVMVTNARGTAHLGGGRIDRVQRWMKDNLPCPGTCLWRDDLDRRFDSAPTGLRIKYPELLTGQDGIEIALATLLGPQRERQLRVVRSFVGHQFNADASVKFKQVNLANSLAGLFIDIPIRFNESMFKQIRRHFRDDDTAQRVLGSLGAGVNALYYLSRGGAVPAHMYRSRTGAADFLLSDVAQEVTNRVVLEGAPGQGKSTLAQFVCQVHRAAFLEKDDFLSSIPDSYAQNPFRLPVKMDLRDLATFVGGEEAPRASFDEFVSDLIHRDSGKQAFTVDDLHDVLGATPVLFFLDGLDEVADLDQRRNLIQAVQDALRRYETLGMDVQVVVTSRPSVFGRKANFDETGFLTIDLASIDRKLALDYSQKWVRVRELEANEAAEVLTILKEKLEVPHIVELTRNAMQLTILLSLIHQIGYSLPDQRTDLYRRYLQLFLIRESEKSSAVKKHQAVLVEFIQHLAWVLQSQAESAGSRGSISKDDLKQMAMQYLADVEQPVELAEDLFGGGLERIFVLVQRVSGLYEFEVQPLREFFCARHLYETSPVGTYRYQTPKGDRAQRFEALAANPFWLNVTRFYAGSYEPGEIGSLVMSLKDLISSKDAAVSLHGREVAFALISDWVFANKKSWQDELIRAACDSVGVALLVQQIYGSGDPLQLDEDCGRDTLRDLVFDEMCGLPLTLSARGHCAVMSSNGGSGLSGRFMELLAAVQGSDRSALFERFIFSGAADAVELSEVFALAQTDSPSLSELGERLSLFVDRFGRSVQDDPPLLQAVVRQALDGTFVRGSHSSSVISCIVDLVCHFPSGVMLLSTHNDMASFAEEVASVREGHDSPAREMAELILRIVHNENPMIAHQWAPAWERTSFVSECLEEFYAPTVWAAYLTALRAAGMQTSADVRGASSLFDESVSLPARARYARLKRSSVAWWKEQLAAAENDEYRRMFWVALVLGWTAPDVFEALVEEAGSVIDSLNPRQYSQVDAALRSMSVASEARRDRKDYVPPLKAVSDSLLKLITSGFRLRPSQVASEIRRRDNVALKAWYGRDRRSLEVARAPGPGASDTVLRNWLRRVFDAQVDQVPIHRTVVEQCRGANLSESNATKVAMSPDCFPSEAFERAVELLMGSYEPATLTAVAVEENWTFLG
jgi:hypothetical protein